MRSSMRMNERERETRETRERERERERDGTMRGFVTLLLVRLRYMRIQMGNTYKNKMCDSM